MPETENGVPPTSARQDVYLQRIDPAYLTDTAAEGRLFAVVDGTVAPRMAALAVELGPDRAACLYLGSAAENYADKAPYLISIDRAMAADLASYFGEDAWGCLLTSSEGRDTVRRHLRGLLTVSSPEGERWLFRFWDPRLLPAFLRASAPDELNAFFGPVAAFALLDPDGQAFAAWRDLAVTDVPPRRSVGGRLTISRAQVAALRRVGVADRLAETFGARQAYSSPAKDAVLVPSSDGGVMRMGLGSDGLVDGVTSPLGRHWALTNREDGKLARLVTPSGSELALAYDDRGNVAQVSRDGQERFRAHHDRTGRLERVEFPDGTTALTDYASQGAAALADPNGDLVAARRDRLGNVEQFAYDRDLLVAAADGAGNVTHFDHGATRRPEATVFADGGREEYRYDPAGHLARLVRSDGQALDITADDKGRPLRIAASDGAVSAFDYDEAGRLVGARNAEVALAWRYDEAGRLIEERQGDAAVRHYYDAAGSVGLTYPTGETVAWRRDLDQRIVKITDWSGDRYDIAYADSDAGWRMTGPDGVAATVRQDRTGMTTSVRVEAAGRALWETAYAYDAEDRLSDWRDSRIGATAYAYDAEGQLLSAERSAGPAEHFSYDPAGNRTSSPEGAATFDVCNRILAQGATAFRHDARGAMVERTGVEGNWRFHYDGFDRLVLAEDDRGRRVAFGYDPLGRRIWKRATDGSAETLTRFIWAGEQVIREVIEHFGAADGWGSSGAPAAVTRDYLYWPQSWTPLLLREGDVTYRYHTDPLGVPLRLTAPGGRIVWEADHDAFGGARILTQEVAQPLRLPGQYADDEFGLGLHYNRFRYYDPATGRYISRDPIGVAGGLNLYLYAGNDPVNKADPLGLWWKTALSIVAAVAVAAVVVVTAPVTAPAALVIIAAGAAAGAAGFMVNEALNQEKFCASCILLAGLKGAAIGAVAAVPFVFLPATAGVAAFMGVGAGSGLIGYGGDCLLNGHSWNWKDAAIAAGIGAVTAGGGRYLAGRWAARPPKTTAPAGMSMGEAVGSGRAQQWTEAGRANAARNKVDASHLSDDQIAAIHGYTTNEGYTQLNPALRGQTPMTPETEAFSRHLTDGMNKLPAVDKTTFRGSTPPQSVIDQYQPGATISDAAPKSTSLDPNKAFSGQLTEKVQGTSGRDVSAFSNYDEAEILFKPGTRFEVLDRVDNPDGTTTAIIRELP